MKAIIVLALSAVSFTLVGITMYSVWTESVPWESKDERDIKQYVLAGKNNPKMVDSAPASVQKNSRDKVPNPYSVNLKVEYVAPKKVEFIQWGPNWTKSKVERICRVIYRADGEVHDELFYFKENDIVFHRPNNWGDRWVALVNR